MTIDRSKRGLTFIAFTENSPAGFTCDVSAGTCDRVDTQSELTKLSVRSVECDDGSTCPTGTTCCKLSSGGYGCCPYPEAVCCDDGEHCCPNGKPDLTFHTAYHQINC